jgi:cytochrome c biogenesis protein CcmG/thiol:disulfide interchange protein DsbE
LSAGRRFRVPLAVILLLSAYMSWQLWRGGAARPPAGGPPQVGSVAPDFALAGVDGGTVRLGDFRGRIVLVNFWASWCEPCRQEMPAIQDFLRSQPGALAVVGVDEGESPTTVALFLRDHPYGWTFALDRDSRVGGLYGVGFLPTSFWIDARGIVRAVHRGPMTPDLLRSFLRQAQGVSG